jgi:hypothetical protein
MPPANSRAVNKGGSTVRKAIMAGCIGLACMAIEAHARPKWTPDEGELIRVVSVALDSVLYEGDAKVLIVTFRDGSSYEYYGVENEVFRGLLQAADKGRYYNAHIRGAYESQRIQDWAAAGRP